MKKPRANPRRAVFLDRDGVLNFDSGYVYKLEDLVILPGVKAGLRVLKDLGYLLVVVTNQSGVARGMFTMDDVEAFHNKLQENLDGLIDSFYVCPHYEGGSVRSLATPCKCRKPETKMIDDAVNDFGINVAESFLIGDKEGDIQCGQNAGVRTVQIVGKYRTSESATAVVSDFSSAVRWIVSQT